MAQILSKEILNRAYPKILTVSTAVDSINKYRFN